MRRTTTSERNKFLQVDKLSLFMPYFQVAQQTDQLLSNKFFDTMFSLKSDEMTGA